MIARKKLPMESFEKVFYIYQSTETYELGIFEEAKNLWLYISLSKQDNIKKGRVHNTTLQLEFDDGNKSYLL